ncbi:MAG TPA: outer membrane lipoprotein carrier protein LolA [Vicinamibacterales bacterium]|nr:outer membrane lipoprotein carrier protein LolA [Vicinamibacterales bacterium]
MRTGLVGLLCLAAVAAAAAAAPARDRFDELFARTLERRHAIQSIRASFTETTTSSLLEKPIVAHGTVIAAPPARVIMTYTDPERRVVLIDGQSLVVAWPDRNRRERVDIAQTQKRIDKYFTRADASELRAMFDIGDQPDPAVPGADRVVMRPRRKQIREGLERLELWIDGTSLLLKQMKMTFPGGDTKTIALDAVTVNVPVSDATFQIRSGSDPFTR